MAGTCEAHAFKWTGDNETEWIEFAKNNELSLYWSFIKDGPATTMKVYVDLFGATGYGRPNEWITVPVGKVLVFADTQCFPQIANQTNVVIE